MDSENQENRKFQITQNFIDALDYLLDSGRLKTVVEFESVTGFRAQRITGMRKFLSGDENAKPYYANAEHLAALNESFGISLKYLLFGVKPILEEKEERKSEVVAGVSPREFQIVQEQMELLQQRVKLLDDKVEFYKSLISKS
ncbi:hypothetical protein DFQ04_0421 [Algoriphagus boseongensis]|uniref:Uncharacterized protein n=1 Tax=Algoriphagus boseongensis TaxID=1442587 RepID=A0A4R6T7I0_9BACT|nr:hypothetical protein [Algoriphagus boseongensis]TDQ18616.1 hypothetical protein DFQ04_0421 [Algoriphagus boseongensis]